MTYSWPIAILTAIDQVGNAIAQGWPDITISARLGGTWSRGGVFKILGGAVDWAFAPIQKQHTWSSYRSAVGLGGSPRVRRGSDVGMVLLVLVVSPFLLPIRIATQVRAWTR